MGDLDGPPDPPGARKRSRSVVGLVASIVVLLAACAAHRTTPATQISQRFPDESSAEARPDLVESFLPCVSELGRARQLPESAFAPGDDDRELVISLSGDGLSLLSDGYRHWLVLERASGLFYIIQFGGIIGAQIVFGPFHPDTGCLVFPPVGQDWMSLEGR